MKAGAIKMKDLFGAKAKLETPAGQFSYFRLEALSKAGVKNISRLPVTLRIILENLVRHADGRLVKEEDVLALAGWNPKKPAANDVPFIPARVILQDFTGVPAVVDLAAMRDAVRRLGGNPKKINPIVAVDLVIDHSVQVDVFGTADAFALNVDLEYKRNGERYSFLRWAQKAFRNFSVVPPGTGIVHQVNLEYLAKVVWTGQEGGEMTAFPDTLVGTDSHTTMINGLGVLGWGVGGIEAEACMLGQPLYQLAPEVIGFKLSGQMPAGATATDLVLTVTSMLRKKGVVSKFVEFYGPGVAALSLADRATVANMSPEYGATVGFFPVDKETLRYLKMTGRQEAADLTERYMKEQGLFLSENSPEPVFSDTLELDLSKVEPCLAGPKRPQDRVALKELSRSFPEAFKTFFKPGQAPAALRKTDVEIGGRAQTVADGSVVIAAITSCTNTSNPAVMIGAGLLAKKAVEKGLSVNPYVKTSLAPGSRVVSDYLRNSGLLPYLEKLNFHLVGYGCTTCIGNSGPLPDAIAKAVKDNDLVAVAVLSGNRNFEGRIHPLVKASYLASPPLVVAYALAGRVDIDLTTQPLAAGSDGKPVYLKDIWPSSKEVQETLGRFVTSKIFKERYSEVFEGDERWKRIPVPESDLYKWDEKSSYIKEPPFFKDFKLEPEPPQDIKGARVLALLGDSITTDHISPAGSIHPESPAGRYLVAQGVGQKDFNSYGARRGNYEVMARGTFANARLKNLLTPDAEGWWTRHVANNGGKTTIYEASERYAKEGVPLIILGGKEYGSGSSRDWAAKGPMLLGIKAVIAESYERIHRSNLVGMGILPLEFKKGENAADLGLTGDESFDIPGIKNGLKPRQQVTVTATGKSGGKITFSTTTRLESPVEVDYYVNGGILPTVLRQMLKGKN
ncbi:MAG: aconitate hydratase AcnA [Elusimicrobia bacterium]|nr:aconitate hydratase AcnA [Elusimicrobiota bacterium]